MPARSPRRRQAEYVVLHQAIREHPEASLRAAADAGDGVGLPKFIEQESREFRTCGALSRRRALSLREPRPLRMRVADIGAKFGSRTVTSWPRFSSTTIRGAGPAPEPGGEGDQHYMIRG